MDVQETSIEAFHDMSETGEIAGQRAVVERAFAKREPGTSREVLSGAGLDHNLNLARARVTELADVGALIEVDRRPCKITGRSAIVWQHVVANRVPRDKRDAKRIAIEELCCCLEGFLDDPTINTAPADAQRMRDLIADSRSL